MFRRRTLLLGIVALTLGACAADKPPVVRELTSPAPPGSAEPNLHASEARVYLSWLKHEDDAHQLQYAVLENGSWSAPRTIVSGDDFFANWADRPSVVELQDGSLVAHWLAKSGEDTYAYDVRLTHSTDGVTWKAATRPHADGTQTEHGFVSILPDGDDQAWVVWLDGRNYANKDHDEAEMQMRAASFSAAGNGSETILDPRTCDCCPTSAVGTDRGVLVAYRDRSPEEIRDIWLVRHENGRWSEPYALSDDGWQISGCPVNGPTLDAAGSRVVATWFTMAQTPAVRLAFSNDSGMTFPVNVRVDEGDPIGRSDVLLLPSGDALVAWLESGQDTQAEIRARHVAADGTLGEPFLVTTTSADRASGFPQMVLHGRSVYFAWTEVGEPSRVQMATLELCRSWR